MGKWMNLTRRHILCGGAALVAGCVGLREREPVIHRDDFDSGLDQWLVEAEQPGRIAAANSLLDIDVPAGATVWFRPVLEGPVAIDYDAVAVAEGGPNDAVSDLNCFWMATDPRAPSGDALARRRSGAFAEYDELRTYYAGIGGNRNKTTRFRRYVGERDNRPLLPEHDLSGAQHMLVSNRWTHIRLIAAGRRIALLRDGAPVFELDDSAPYTRGHFALRTTKSHVRIAKFRVRRLAVT
jgi:hypothetical protein